MALILPDEDRLIFEERIQRKIELWRDSQPERNTLSSDKTGATVTNPIDNQIANGVDFFDDNLGSHTGFVTKTDLVSRYHQFIKGNVVAERAGERTNTKTRSAYGQSGEYDELPGVGLSSTSHIIDGDVIIPPRNQLSVPYYASLLPIEDRASMYDSNGSYTFIQTGTNPPNSSDYPPFNLLDQVTLYGIPAGDGLNRFFTITNQPGGFHQNNPVVDANVGFMVTPISDYVSNLNTNPATDTHNVLAVSSTAAANTMMGTTADYLTTKNLGPFVNTFDNVYGGGTLLQLWNSNQTRFQYGSGDVIDFTDSKENNSANEFLQVPNGLNVSNLFGTDNMRNVSNKGPFEGSRVHPILVRNFGTNWKDDLPDEYGILDEYNNPFGLLSQLYINMSAAAVRRTTIWSNSTAGSVWLSQQEDLQNLNPTFETREFNKFAVIGEKGLKVLQYTHKTRHTNHEDNRYEKLLKGETLPEFLVDAGVGDDGGDIVKSDYGFGSRIAMQGNYNIAPNAEVTLNAFGVVGDFEAGNPVLPLGNGIFFVNPNRYTGTLSAAPVTITDGIPSFAKNAGTGDGTTAKSDADKILNTQGGTFNKEAHSYDATRSDIAQKYATLAYGRLNKLHSYEDTLKSPAELIGFMEDDNLSEGSIFPDATLSGQVFGIDFTVSLGDVPSTANLARRRKEKRINDAVGNSGVIGKTAVSTVDPVLGVVKKSTFGSGISAGAYDGTDKINMAPYGTQIAGEDVYYTDTKFAQDFIKFRFYDIINQKYIIFRAILSGVSDTISTDYGEEKYIGRPDKLYVYKGADRDLSFNFKIYPKTKQEFPILIEKMNYLVGLCYPSLSTQNRMKTPFMHLTIGDMYNKAPGILRNVSITVDDNTTWEMDEGLQFPKHINVACQFRYIGSHMPLGTDSRHFGGIRPSDVDNPTPQEIFDKYINFDFGADGSVIDSAAAYVDDKLGISKAISGAGKKASNFVSGLFS